MDMSCLLLRRSVVSDSNDPMLHPETPRGPKGLGTFISVLEAHVRQGLKTW